MNTKHIRFNTRAIAIAAFLTLSATALLLNHAASVETAGIDSAALPTRPALPLDEALHAPAAELSLQTGLEHLPESLQGVAPPNGLIIDEAGNLVVTHTLRELYDYFLSALGEESLPMLRARVRTYIAKSLPPRASQHAQAIFDGYLNYRQALMHLPQAGGKPVDQLDLAAVTAQKNAELALRSQYLSPDVAAAFFGNEDAYDRYTLARLQLQADKTLSASQKHAREQALFAQLPADTQASLKTAQKLQDLDRINAECRQQQCSPAQLHQRRADAVGVAAADRLQALDEERAAWKTRVDSYLSQRAAILANPGYSGSDKQTQIQQLRAGFTAPEQLRLAAFEQQQDRVAALTP